MNKHKMASVFVGACITLVISACGTSSIYAPISQSEAISLAKQAAMTSPSGPRVYKVSLEGNGQSSQAREWPDSPGSKVGSHIMGGGCKITNDGCIGVPTLPITFTTAVASDTQGQRITFSAVWQWDNGTETQHRWVFFVNNTKQASFVDEEGDELPPLPR